MKKRTALLLSVMVMGCLSGASVYAENGAKKPHSKVRHAIHELNEAKAVFAKMTPDAAGHTVKAAQNVDLAIQELSQIKE